MGNAGTKVSGDHDIGGGFHRGQRAAKAHDVRFLETRQDRVPRTVGRGFVAVQRAVHLAAHGRVQPQIGVLLVDFPTGRERSCVAPVRRRSAWTPSTSASAKSPRSSPSAVRRLTSPDATRLPPPCDKRTYLVDLGVGQSGQLGRTRTVSPSAAARAMWSAWTGI